MIKIDPKPITKDLRQLKLDVYSAVIRGNYKEYSKAKKDYASLAVKNIEEAQNLNFGRYSVSLFSRTGLRMIKIWFLDLFRRESKDEKLLRKLMTDRYIKTKLGINK